MSDAFWGGLFVAVPAMFAAMLAYRKSEQSAQRVQDVTNAIIPLNGEAERKRTESIRNLIAMNNEGLQTAWRIEMVKLLEEHLAKHEHGLPKPDE